MKIKALCLAALLAAGGTAFAYNPPFGGEEMYRITNPEMMAGFGSAVGSPEGDVVPASISYNPALPACQQRVDLDLNGTFLANSNKRDGDDRVGFAVNAGLIIPSKWGILAGSTDVIMSDFERMHIKRSVTVHAGASKEITEKLALGANIYGGCYFAKTSDWVLGLDLGGIYKLDDFACFRKARIGVSLLNMGKPVTKYETIGIEDEDDEGKYFYPGIFTPRVGFGANYIERENFSAAFNADLSFPTFQNVVFDCAFSFNCMKILNFYVAWQGNLREIIEGKGNGINWPAIGASARFRFRSKSLKGANKDWEESEVTPKAAWQNLYNGVHAISAGARVDMGLKDTDGPEITLW